MLTAAWYYTNMCNDLDFLFLAHSIILYHFSYCLLSFCCQLFYNTPSHDARMCHICVCMYVCICIYAYTHSYIYM